MTDIKAATYQWLTLLVLTCISFALAEIGFSGGSIVLPVLIATLVKGSIVIDRFMALRHVSGPWRFIVLGWLFTVVGLIWFSFSKV